jgi:hypothetical protein
LGVDAVMDVDETHVIEVQELPAIVTFNPTPETKFVPVTVMLSPPAVVPWLGLTDITVGAVETK